MIQSQHYNSDNNDEIDLRELWLTVVKHKKFIGLMTSCVTILAVVFVFMKTPIYEIKAILEIGFFNTSTFFETPTNLVKKLEQNYIDNQGESQEKTLLTKVSLVKGSINLVELVVEAQSNNEALAKLLFIEEDVKQKHKQIIESYLNQINIKISNLKAQKEDLLQEKEKLNEFIHTKTNLIDKILKDNAAVAAVYSIELNNKTLELTELKNKIYTLNSQISDLEILLAPSSLKETSILGEITKSDKPVKPKKALLVVVSFVTGLILSTFLVFIIEMFRKQNNIINISKNSSYKSL